MTNTLNIESFNKYPVWQFTDDNEGHQPVPGFNGILPLDKGTLFIKSKFVTPSGVKFDGYVIGIDSYYGFGLFCIDEVCLFNLSLPQYYGRSIRLLEETLGLNHIELFPLKFVTEVKDKDGKTIKGFFEKERRYK